MQKTRQQIDENNFSTLEGFFQEVSDRLIARCELGTQPGRFTTTSSAADLEALALRRQFRMSALA